uniref:Uncharacterized protein n=1 Tax=Romanomermis culicivorax TaxID=13658 RepID=A0A915K6H0_ROMCU
MDRRGAQAFLDSTLLLRTIDIDTLVSTFREASINFKSWWKRQQGKLYLARMKPFWGFMKCLQGMFENPSLDDAQLALHLWITSRPVRGLNG